MHRFILPSVSAESGQVLLDLKESHHARNVLRVKPGEVVELLDGAGGKFRAVVAGFEEGRVALSVDRRTAEAGAAIEITLAAAVIKPERMEWMLEKCCELGVSRWIPVLTERNVVKLSRERWEVKIQRWRKIASETCKQSGQARVPQLSEPVLYKEIIKETPAFDAAWIPTLGVPGQTLKAALSGAPKARKVLVLIGPEGDFTDKEVQLAVSNGVKPVSLGAHVLRAETAALYALSTVHFFYAKS